MRKQKQALTWPLSILIITVSFLSILVVYRQVEAAWLEPNYLPSDTNLLNNFVFTPLAQNLDLGGKNITGNGNISINGAASFTSLTVNGIPVSGGSGGTGSADWAINYTADRALYFSTTTGSGYVGIGTATPNKLLHLYSPSPKPNAEIDIQSVAGAGNHWAMYHDASTDQLRFWKGNADRVIFQNSGDVSISRHLTVGGNLTVTGTINGSSGGTGSGSDWLINSSASNALYYTTTTASGYVGIGTNAPNKLLHLYSTSPNAEIDIQSVAGVGNHWAMYHDASTDQLRFWKSAGNNVLTLAANGRVGVGTSPDNNNIFKTFTSSVGVAGLYGENNSTDFSYFGDGSGVNPNNIGVKGVASTGYGGGVGVYGSGFYGVKGVGGIYGLYGEAAAGGTALWAKQASGRAALFQGQTDVEGLLKVTGNVQITGADNYLYVTSGSGAPSTACNFSGATGRVYIDYTNFRFYICTGASGWKYKTFDNL